MATIMDTEKGDEGREMAKPQNSKRIVNPKKIFVGSVLLVCMLAVMFGMGVLAARYSTSSPLPKCIWRWNLINLQLKECSNRTQLFQLSLW